jgi:hypothetical protein
VLLAAAAGQVDDPGQREQLPGRQHRRALARSQVIRVHACREPEFLGAQPLGDDDAGTCRPPGPVAGRHPEHAPGLALDERAEVRELAPLEVPPQPPVVKRARGQRLPCGGLAGDQRQHEDPGDGGGVIPRLGQPAIGREHRLHLDARNPAEQRAVPRHRNAGLNQLADRAGDGLVRPDLHRRAVAAVPVPQHEQVVPFHDEDKEPGRSRSPVHQHHRAVPVLRVVAPDRQRVGTEELQARREGSVT